MAKKPELDVHEDPKFLYQLTQSYMLKFVKERGNKEDRIWYAKLGLDSQKEVTRSGKTFMVLDVTTVRNEFAKRFFPYLLEKKPSATKKSYTDELKELLAAAEAE